MSLFSAGVQRLEVAPAVAVIELDLLGRLAPAPRRPVDIGAQADRLAAGDVGDDVEREVVAADVALRARLQQQPLLPQFAGEIGDAGGAQRRDRPVRLAVGQIDHREPCRDLRARRALQPLVDLVLQEFGGLVEQIDRDQPVGEATDHLVAAPADRRQFADTRRTCPSASIGGRSSPFGARKSCENSADARILRLRARLPNWAAAWSRCAPRRSDRRSARCRRRCCASICSVLTSMRVAAPGHRQRLEFAQARRPG